MVTTSHNRPNSYNLSELTLNLMLHGVKGPTGIPELVRTSCNDLEAAQSSIV